LTPAEAAHQVLALARIAANRRMTSAGRSHAAIAACELLVEHGLLVAAPEAQRIQAPIAAAEIRATVARWIYGEVERPVDRFRDLGRACVRCGVRFQVMDLVVSAVRGDERGLAHAGWCS
jgi:hypothetical protein